jgi:hypothetical protein
MKKWVIGCLSVFVLATVAVGIGGFYLYNKARTYLGQFTQLAELDKSVTNTSPYTAPANSELTADQMTRFAAVEDYMTTKLGPTFDQMKAKQDQFVQRQNAEHREATPAEVLSVITDGMKFILMAKNAQVEALNQQHFSLDEYSWVRGQVYSAAGMELAALNLSNLPDAIKAGGGGNVTQQVGGSGTDVPEHNKELVKPYLPKLKDWAVYAFFGM